MSLIRTISSSCKSAVSRPHNTVASMSLLFPISPQARCSGPVSSSIGYGPSLDSLPECQSTDLLMFSDAEKHREKERLAAIAIQTNWRMLRVKWNFEKKVRACRTIERVFRGHTGRLSFYNKKEEVFRQRQKQFYEEQAKIVQK